MKNYQQIIDELETIKESMDELIGPWSEAKAGYLKHDELKKIKLAYHCELFDGSEASKKNKALIHPDYMKYIEETKFEADKGFFMIDAQKKSAEQRTDVLRSRLSFEKERINMEV